MIAEVAVEPEVMAHWKHFHSLHADFGVAQGKLLCEFPGKWRKKVLKRARELADEGVNSPRQTQMIIDQLDEKGGEKKHTPFLRALIPTDREYNEADWLNSARSVDPVFDLLIHSSDSRSPEEFTAGEFLKDSTLYARPKHIEVQREAEALIECGWNCFRQAKEIYVVDPYFGPVDQKFGKVLKHLLTRLQENKVKPSRIEVHTALRDSYDEGIQQRNWERWARGTLPDGWTIKVVYWKTLETGSKMHARSILTDFGGLDYNWGTDEDPQEFTQVSLLDDPFWQKLYQRFSRSSDELAELAELAELEITV